MKLRVALVLLALALLFGAFLHLPGSPNIGVPFGYYGELNRVTHAVQCTPGLDLEKVAMHQDVSLEDFWITVRTPAARTFTIDVFDGGAVRDADDPADGVVLCAVSYGNECLALHFASDFWSSVYGGTPTCLEDLLPRMDAFLKAVDETSSPNEVFDTRKFGRFIKLLYQPNQGRARGG